MSDDLIRALESALADMTDQAKLNGEVLGGIEDSLARALHALAQRNVLDLEPLVRAISDMRPAVQINVPPIQVPSPVVHFQPAAEFVVTINDSYGRPERSMTIKRLPAAA